MLFQEFTDQSLPCAQDIIMPVLVDSQEQNSNQESKRQKPCEH